MDKAWYSVEEVSKTLGVSKQTIRDKLATKQMTGNKVGREWRILKSEVDLILGVSEKVNDKDIYIKDLESKVTFLTKQIETMKSLITTMAQVVN